MANFKSELPHLNPEFYLNFTLYAKRQGWTHPATFVIKALAQFCHFLSLLSRSSGQQSLARFLIISWGARRLDLRQFMPD
jgi:hypothetical protein